MKEEFLHYIWKHKLYNQAALKDGSGSKILVIDPGQYNRDSGPDFFNARIEKDGIVWAGNIEIHIKSSHFITHGHDHDHAYDNVILHAVLEKDSEVYNCKGEMLLTCELQYDEEIYTRYENLLNNPGTIACHEHIPGTGNFLLRHWLSVLAIERLQQKSESITRIYNETGNDWEETLYRTLARYFGFRVNTEPFEMLAAFLPLKIIRKHSDNLFQVESLMFGTAGMLEEGLFREALSDTYYQELIREYRILSAKYSLKSVHGWLWKFSKMRPVNFPTVRISQLAAMLCVSGGLFSRIIEANNITCLKSLIEVNASDYWNDHFVFGKRSKGQKKRTGELATDILLINAIIPVIFIYGKMRDQQDLCDGALEMLENLSPENNAITGEWKQTGLEVKSAFQSQALIQLRNEYCRKRRCLECWIGSRLVEEGRSLRDNKDLLLEPAFDES